MAYHIITVYSTKRNNSCLPWRTLKIDYTMEPIHILWLLPVCSATSPYFYLPPHYEPTTAMLNISLEIANLNMINISVLDFHVWQHLENHQNETQLQHLAIIPLVSVNQLYKCMISGITPITPFTSPEESTGDTVSIWTLFSHTGVYVMAISSLIPARLGIFCCYFFWSQPARLACQPLQPGTMQYTIVDDDVEAASIYRCNGRAKKPTRPCKNHGLHMEWVPTWMSNRWVISSSCMQIIEIHFQNPGNTEMYIISVVRLRIVSDQILQPQHELIDVPWMTIATSHN